MRIVPDPTIPPDCPCSSCSNYEPMNQDNCKTGKADCQQFWDWYNEYWNCNEPMPIEITDAEWDEIYASYYLYVENNIQYDGTTVIRPHKTFAQYLRELLELKGH